MSGNEKHELCCHSQIHFRQTQRNARSGGPDKSASFAASALAEDSGELESETKGGIENSPVVCFERCCSAPSLAGIELGVALTQVQSERSENFQAETALVQVEPVACSFCDEAVAWQHVRSCGFRMLQQQGVMADRTGFAATTSKQTAEVMTRNLNTLDFPFDANLELRSLGRTAMQVTFLPRPRA